MERFNGMWRPSQACQTVVCFGGMCFPLLLMGKEKAGREGGREGGGGGGKEGEGEGRQNRQLFKLWHVHVANGPNINNNMGDGFFKHACICNLLPWEFCCGLECQACCGLGEGGGEWLSQPIPNVLGRQASVVPGMQEPATGRQTTWPLQFSCPAVPPV